MKIIVMVGIVLLVLAVLIVRDVRKQKTSKRQRKVTKSLQEFLPIERFHDTGAVVVNGRFRRLIRVGDLNLYSMAIEEIEGVRDRYKEMLQRLDNPFQISVQARRANYTDFVKYAESTISDTVKSYQNQLFAEFAEALQVYIRNEAQKPRTDRENLFIVGVLPKLGGETDQSQLERLDMEQGYVELGFSNMGVQHKALEPIEFVEACQNFWNRERAVSQRYRDAVVRRTHADRVDGAAEIDETEVRQSVRKEA